MTTVQPIISTPDLDRLRAFYERVFGAVETERHPPEGPVFFVNLKVGDSVVGLVAEAPEDMSAAQRIVLAAFVDDVDALLDRVVEAGGSLLGPANDMPWGHRVAHVHDPDGNLVNLTQVL